MGKLRSVASIVRGREPVAHNDRDSIPSATHLAGSPRPGAAIAPGALFRSGGANRSTLRAENAITPAGELRTARRSGPPGREIRAGAEHPALLGVVHPLVIAGAAHHPL